MRFARFNQHPFLLRGAGIAGSLILTLCLHGCQTKKPASPPPTPTATPEASKAPRFRPGGVVRRVNAGERYLIFESRLPFPPGIEAYCIRGNTITGRLLIPGQRRRDYELAEVISGRPQAGDIVEPLLPEEREASTAEPTPGR